MQSQTETETCAFSLKANSFPDIKSQYPPCMPCPTPHLPLTHISCLAFGCAVVVASCIGCTSIPTRTHVCMACPEKKSVALALWSYSLSDSHPSWLSISGSVIGERTSNQGLIYVYHWGCRGFPGICS